MKKKSILQKFKTHREALDRQFLEFYQRGFDPMRARKFLQQARSSARHKPALYRFRTFDELSRFDREEVIKESVS